MLGGIALACASAPSDDAARQPATGLDLPFPPLVGEATTLQSVAGRVELGRLLFFDRALSGPRDAACADCHRPELAFTDGEARARGISGPLPRNTPTLYNVGFKQRLFWDRRAPSLEQQVFTPLFSPEEMAADPAQLLARLRALPEYREHFAAVFPDAPASEAITLENLARAIAAFERTLVSRDSRYDRYTRGDAGALSAAEVRGLALFRSLNTRCFECHRLPTFDAPLAVGIGVPSQDPGVGAVTGLDAQRGAFGVPTLRNVSRTAPYMHDGSFATLEEVIDFYRQGGGRAFGMGAERVHEHVRPFDIRDDEAADLVAFLRALDDESARPSAPLRVPSGLPLGGSAAPEAPTPSPQEPAE